MHISPKLDIDRVVRS